MLLKLFGNVIGQEWRDKAACRGLDPEIFFPERGDSLTLASARAVCRDCDVQVECLEYALDYGERMGVWGGTSERDRQKIRKRRAAEAYRERNRVEADTLVS